jgi:hypothetical protein
VQNIAKHFYNMQRNNWCYFFFEDKESKTDLNSCNGKAMEQMGRGVDKLPKLII